MRRATLLAAVVLLAGCGEKSEPDLDDIPPPRPTATATPQGPAPEEAKMALRNAATAMEVFYTDEQRYTDDRSALVNDFPASVRIEQATADTYRLSAQAGPTRFTLARDAQGRLARECAPPDPARCPGGRW